MNPGFKNDQQVTNDGLFLIITKKSFVDIVRPYSFGDLLKTELVEAKIPLTLVLFFRKTVDFADFRLHCEKAHSFGHSVFGVDFREIIDVFFWALPKTVDYRGMKKPAPGAGRLPDRLQRTLFCKCKS